MKKLLRLVQRILPSNAAEGKLGSIELNVWLGQLVGVPLLGLKQETPLQKLCIIAVGYPIVLAVWYYVYLELYDLYLNWHDLDAMTQNLILSFTHIAFLIKFCNICYHYGTLKSILQKLSEITRRCVVSEQQMEAFQRAELKNKLANLIYFHLVLTPGLMSIVYVLIAPEEFAGNRFPYRAEMPNSLPRIVQSLYKGFSVSLLALETTSIDFLNISVMGQICMHLKVLSLAFDQLHERTKVDAYSWLVAIVKYHCELIVLRQQVERIFNLAVMLQFVSSVVIIAMTAFQVIVIGDGSKSSNVMNLMLCCVLCQLFMYCYFGNEVYEQSKTLSSSGFGCNWYSFDRKCKKTLLIFMINADRPFLFTAGGFMALTLSNFTYIISKSYSIVAVLRQMYSRS
ncbi:odorant receptor 2a-like [Drosophila hydei]|uniref:Odorant receptor n=1 Tax=Drosophila hydei TaxID=7224 RepID=A0A6J1M2E9_DROHY|nr:odorant receptor 2a-like [Drosophila hydei]